AEEYEGNVVFLHQIKDGPADESYGIHVAKLADLPSSLINRATALLTQFESSNSSAEETSASLEEEQLTMFVEEQKPNAKKGTKSKSNVESYLKGLDLMEMTPMDAMNELYQLQKRIKS
ncbi:MAG: DNA mismatch repair protein MutS, partial [Halobacillus sp.]